MRMDLRYSLLAEYLSFLSDDLNLDVVVNDMCGIYEADPILRQVLQPYKTHKNPYCMYVKNNQTLWSQCIILKDKLMQYSQSHPVGFFGTCHCGVGEFVLPITQQARITGFLSATGYRTDATRLTRRLPRTAERYALNMNELQSLYDQHMRDPSADTQRALMHLKVVRQMLHDCVEQTMSYSDMVAEAQIQSGKLIARALDYMNEMYANPIDLAEIARHCACSKSHLQHLFQQVRGRTIWETLSDIRMAKARLLLQETDLPIYTLAAMVGFNDANYFSSAFSRTHRVSPRQFRKQRKQDSANLKGDFTWLIR